jgi:hypothetical protein
LCAGCICKAVWDAQLEALTIIFFFRFSCNFPFFVFRATVGLHAAFGFAFSTKQAPPWGSLSLRRGWATDEDAFSFFAHPRLSAIPESRNGLKMGSLRLHPCQHVTLTHRKMEGALQTVPPRRLSGKSATADASLQTTHAARISCGNKCTPKCARDCTFAPLRETTFR